MVVPWLGFPMKRIIDDVEPTSEAKYVRFHLVLQSTDYQRTGA